MAPIYETGHAKNVANLERLISFCTGYGKKYAPTKQSITLTNLNNLHSNASNSLATVNNLLAASTNAINERESIFEPLSKLITKVVNSLEASDVPKQIVPDARTIAKKLQGIRASKKQPTVIDDPLTPEDESQKSISASQMSFDNRIENLDKLVQLLQSQGGYSPNEPELTVSSLHSLLAELRNKNTAAINSYMLLNNARIHRNNLLYGPETGIFDICSDVKKYIKSVFGADAQEYKQINTLKFTKPKL